jgi:pterin-4a-carbinolamine dehydratase
VSLEGWVEADGVLQRTWPFHGMARPSALAAAIAGLCDRLGHHAEVTAAWGSLTVRTTTHDAGNVVTDLDRQLAEAVEALVNADEEGFRRHVFVCTHERPEGSARPSCARRGSMDLMVALKRSARDLGLDDVRVQKSGCLDRCEAGPSAVVYPEGRWMTLPSNVNEVEALAKDLV